MPERSFLAIPELYLGGSLKEGSVFVVTRKGQPLPQLGIICPPVPEPTLPKSSPKMIQIVDAKTP
jgi:hypothetical protein